MRRILSFLLFSAMLLFAVACSQGEVERTTENAKDTVEKNAEEMKNGIVEDLDAVTTELEETARKLKEKSQTVKNEVDELLKDI